MNRELNELKSRAINRTGFIGTVINMPRTPRGVGSGVFSIPRSLLATKKGKEILRRLGALLHSHCLYPSPYDKGSSTHFKKYWEGGEPGNKAIWSSPGDSGCPSTPLHQLHLTRGVVREGSAGPGSPKHPGGPGQPAAHPPGSHSPRPVGYSQEQLLANQGNAFISSLEIHTITWAVAK